MTGMPSGTTAGTSRISSATGPRWRACLVLARACVLTWAAAVACISAFWRAPAGPSWGLTAQLTSCASRGHDDTADAAEGWQNLQYFLRPAQRWPDLLARPAGGSPFLS
jgi:hypothetical protein